MCNCDHIKPASAHADATFRALLPKVNVRDQADPSEMTTIGNSCSTEGKSRHLLVDSFDAVHVPRSHCVFHLRADPLQIWPTGCVAARHLECEAARQQK